MREEESVCERERVYVYFNDITLRHGVRERESVYVRERERERVYVYFDDSGVRERERVCM